MLYTCLTIAEGYFCFLTISMVTEMAETFFNAKFIMTFSIIIIHYMHFIQGRIQDFLTGGLNFLKGLPFTFNIFHNSNENIIF